MDVSNFSDALYKVNVSSLFGEEYIGFFNDAVRMVLLQLTVQLMFYFSVEDAMFWTDSFILLVLYTILGVSLYWLVFRKSVQFV
jgi:hypothetical protein